MPELQIQTALSRQEEIPDAHPHGNALSQNRPKSRSRHTHAECENEQAVKHYIRRQGNHPDIHGVPAAALRPDQTGKSRACHRTCQNNAGVVSGVGKQIVRHAHGIENRVEEQKPEHGDQNGRPIENGKRVPRRFRRLLHVSAPECPGHDRRRPAPQGG